MACVAGVSTVHQLRRRPNCFNLLHQMELQVRAGVTGETAIQCLEVWCLNLMELKNHFSHLYVYHSHFGMDGICNTCHIRI